MQKPPSTFEEFLQSQNLDDWPRYPYFPEVDPRPLIATLRNDYSLENIAKHLYDNVPLSTENLSNVEERVEECKIKVHEHAKKIVHLECSEGGKDQSPLEQAVETSASDSKDFSVMKKKKKKKKKVEFAADTAQDSRCKKVENYNFPGFQSHHLTNLPRQLEAVQLWDSIVKVQTFKGLNLKILKKLFLSEASVALLQDCFWWWFLQKFKPNQEQQDHLFDRISDSFVALLMSTPNYIKDPFFQVYPDCLSQAIYLTFCEAFPNSHFGDEFKDELMDLIFQWIRGFKPQKCAWKKWNLWCLEKPVNCIPKRDSVCLSVFNLFPKERSKSLRFQLTSDEELKRETTEPKKESHYVGDGPHFCRSLFNLGGQSPLVLYYLKTHGISNTLQNSRLYKITHTEICKEPPSSPTYQDVIEESRKFTKQLHSDFLDFEHRYNEQLAEMKEKREKVNWKFQRLLSKVSKNPNELRLRTQDLIQKLENQTPGQAESSTVNSVVKKIQF
ncbi:protein FAM227B isoform X2 [Eublepharis macularius]|uniref:Protein FAM227B isoform X2 n=1 Tax=Eublepharis macularius TaxID=481883 RepID=A0AA97LK90_EUBMA|nr:protein FAM227B isoform X2 [Eublepharis macularius]